MDAVVHVDAVSATKVIDDRDRMGVYPSMFGRYFISGEIEVTEWMRELAKAYTGGFWDFYSLSNGGYFMAPRMGRVQIEAPNEFVGEVSDEAAGIIACLYALSHLAFKVSNDGGDPDALTEQYHALRAYAKAHAESEAIMAAVD